MGVLLLRGTMGSLGKGFLITVSMIMPFFLLAQSPIPCQFKIVTGCAIAFLSQKAIHHFSKREHEFKLINAQYSEHLKVCKKFNEDFPGTINISFDRLKAAHDRWDREVLKSQQYFSYGDKKYTNDGIVWRWQFPPHINNRVEWRCLMSDPHNVDETFPIHESFPSQFVPVIQKNESGERFMDLTIRKSCAKDPSIKSVLPYLWISRAFFFNRYEFGA